MLNSFVPSLLQISNKVQAEKNLAATVCNNLRLIPGAPMTRDVTGLNHTPTIFTNVTIAYLRDSEYPTHKRVEYIHSGIGVERHIHGVFVLCDWIHGRIAVPRNERWTQIVALDIQSIHAVSKNVIGLYIIATIKSLVLA